MNAEQSGERAWNRTGGVTMTRVGQGATEMVRHTFALGPRHEALQRALSERLAAL